MEDAWKIVQHQLEKELPPNSYEPFIKPLKYKEDATAGNTFVLSVADKSILHDLEERYTETIQTRLRSLMGRDVSVQFRLFEDEKVDEAKEKSSLSISHTWMNPSYTFDKFVSSKSNELAYIASQAVAVKPGRTNPLYLYSESGLGKTHLVHAVCHDILSRQPGAKICFLSVEDFKNEFLSSLHSKKTFEFKQKYKQYDVLCIEDLHFLRSAAEATQEEFYYVFNYYYESGKQIIITSEIPAAKLQVSSRLLSRFISGLQVKIDAPDLELRIDFLKQHSVELGFELAPAVLEYLSSRISGNIRELESALNKLYFLNIKGLKIDNVNVVAEHLSELIPVSHNGPISLDHIIEVVCSRYNITKEEILGSSRKSEFTLPRHIAMYLGVKHSNLNKSAIARFFRKNDHTTVINAEKNIKKRIEKDAGFGLVLEYIEETLRKEYH